MIIRTSAMPPCLERVQNRDLTHSPCTLLKKDCKTIANWRALGHNEQADH